MFIFLLPDEGIELEVNRFFQCQNGDVILDNALSTTNIKEMMFLTIYDFGFEFPSLIFVRNVVLSFKEIGQLYEGEGSPTQYDCNIVKTIFWFSIEIVTPQAVSGCDDVSRETCSSEFH